MRIIEIEKDLVPYEFQIELKSTLYTFSIRYNQEYDFYTVDLSIGDDIIVEGEKMVLNSLLFSSYSHLDVSMGILPMDIADKAERLGEKELMDTVFLYLVGDLNV